MASERDFRLDKIRTLSMVLVVCVHAANYYCRAMSSLSPASLFIACIFNAAARISVPAFFMISGALLLKKDYDPKKNRRRIFTKLTTLVFITAVYYFWDRYFMKVGKISVLSLLSQPERRLLWFLYAIIGLYIVLPFIKRMTDGMTPREEKLFLILFIIFGGLLYTLKIKFKYPVPIVGATYSLGYLVSGHIICKNMGKYDLKKFRLPLAVFSAVCFICSALTVFMSCRRTGKYDSGQFSYRNIFIMLSSFCVFILLYSLMKNTQGKLTSVLSASSFGVYLFHGIFLDLFMKIFPYRSVFSLVGIPAAVIAVSSVTFVFVYLLRKIPPLRPFI